MEDDTIIIHGKSVNKNNRNIPTLSIKKSGDPDKSIAIKNSKLDSDEPPKPPIIDVNLAKTIELQRNKLGMSRKDLAIKTNIAENIISKYETPGFNDVKLKELTKISNVLKIPLKMPK